VEESLLCSKYLGWIYCTEGNIYYLLIIPVGISNTKYSIWERWGYCIVIILRGKVYYISAMQRSKFAALSPLMVTFAGYLKNCSGGYKCDNVELFLYEIKTD
jgi:hypothetical protein